MKKMGFMILSLLLAVQVFSQDVLFKVEVSTDSILMDNYMEVRFTIENAAGDFEAPEFDEFEILSGPNTSSSFSMINGKVTQKASYTYVIRPVREGTLYIPPAFFTSGDNELETEALPVEVYPNPAGIEENKTFRTHGYEGSSLRSKKKKSDGPKFKHKKRKI